MKRTPWAVVCLVVACCVSGAIHAQQGDAADAPEGVAKAVAQLGAAEFEDREAAVERLLAIGLPAVPALKQAVRGRDPEVVLRAAHVLDMLMLGINAETPEAVRKLAVGVLREEREEEAYQVRAIGLEKLAKAGPPGWRVLQYIEWCHEVPVRSYDVLPELLGGDMADAVEAGRMDCVLAALSIEACGSWDAQQAYVATCSAEGALDDALERARAWHQLKPSRNTAGLIARLYWAAGRRPEAVRWARAVLADPLPEGGLDRRGGAGDAVDLLVLAGDLGAVADYCERAARQVPETDADGDRNDDAFEDRCRMLGSAAIAAFAAGDDERCDRNLDALQREWERVMQELGEEADRVLSWVHPRVYDYMVICRRSDRAAALAAEHKEFAHAGWIRGFQGRTEDAKRMFELAEEQRAARRRAEAEAEAAEPVPDEPAEPLTAAEQAEALWQAGWRARWDDDDEAAVEAFRKAYVLCRKETLTDMAREMYDTLVDLEMPEAAQLEEQMLDRDSPFYLPETVAAARSGGSGMAAAWCILLDRMHPDAAPRDLVKKAVDAAGGDLPEADVLALAERAATFAREHGAKRIIKYAPYDFGYSVRPEEDDEDGVVLPPVLDLLADTCEKAGLCVRAAEYLREAAEADEEERGRSERAAWILADAGLWADAAGAFGRAYEAESTPPLRYYAGWALQRAGQPEEGEPEMAVAVRQARVMGTNLLRVLLRTGDLEGALAEYELRRRIGLPVMFDLVAVPVIPETLGDHRAAFTDRCRQILRDTMSDSGHYNAGWMPICASYLDVNRALARLQEGEAVDLQALVDTFLNNSVGEQEGAILLVRGLEQFGHRDLADRVYAAAIAQVRARLEEDPEDTSELNHFAWLAGMCGRDLDEALHVAQALLAEEPAEPAYLDTLGAVYYARGEYAKAVETEAQALRYGLPAGYYYEGGKTFWLLQLARFREALAEQEGREADAQ